MPLLFSYGTLQEERVQLATFGRLLRGEKDQLPGFEPRLVELDARLAAADEDERTAAYERKEVRLSSGKQA